MQLKKMVFKEDEEKTMISFIPWMNVNARQQQEREVKSYNFIFCSYHSKMTLSNDDETESSGTFFYI